MLTLMFITFVYTSVLRNRDLKILKATAQRWMINGHGGTSYKIVFTPKKANRKVNVDAVWIHNKPYKVIVDEIKTEEEIIEEPLNKIYSENVLAINLSESQSALAVEEEELPKELPTRKGDAVIVYTIGKKKRYHIISELQQLPFLMAN